MDAFTATLRDYSILANPSVYEKIDKSELAENLAGLGLVALRFAQDPMKQLLRVGEPLEDKKGKSGYSFVTSASFGSADEAEEALSRAIVGIGKGPGALQARIPLPAVTIERGDSLSDVLSKFFHSDWGNTPRTLTNVREALQLFGLNYPKQSVAVALLRLAKGSKIRRFKGEGGEYVYAKSSKQTSKTITGAGKFVVMNHSIEEPSESTNAEHHHEVASTR
jgi:hypothetical protein